MGSAFITGQTGSTIYSTEETLTGDTWIDGRPIYRKVFRVAPNTWTPANIRDVVKAYGYHRGSPYDYKYPILSGYNAVGVNSSGSFQVTHGGGGVTMSDITICIEYTRLTD